MATASGRDDGRRAQTCTAPDTTRWPTSRNTEEQRCVKPSQRRDHVGGVDRPTDSLRNYGQESPGLSRTSTSDEGRRRLLHFMRALWVVSHETGGSTTPGRVSWSRKFASVESRRRARIGPNAKHDIVPDEDEFAAIFRAALAEHQRLASSAVPVLWPSQLPHLAPLVFAECVLGFVVMLPSVVATTRCVRACGQRCIGCDTNNHTPTQVSAPRVAGSVRCH